MLFVHGGPGGGIGPRDRRYFDPKAWRVILFDQRGAGKSTPSACLEDNTTWHLVADMEALRVHCKIETWTLFGGSWGSTLSLAYAVTHPTRVAGLILRGIFTLRRRELEWFYEDKGVGGGAADIFPDEWEKYLVPIPPVERSDIMASYYRRLTGPDPVARLEAARAWSAWECATCKLVRDPAEIAKADAPEWALAFARIECHYFVNHGFMRDGELLERIATTGVLKSIPGVIIQGRYDIVCPAKTAWQLSKAWGGTVPVTFVETAGHSAKEPGITEALISATEQFKSSDDFIRRT